LAANDPAPSRDLDLAVLAHLRGFPDELRRFSNLMKQSHSEGGTAIAFYLSRPAAEDSFVLALCRLVLAGEAVATVVEAAELLGVTPVRLLEWASGPDFPRPIWGQGRHQLWRRADLSTLRPADGGSAPRVT
jgi:hypothetical protein